jgi:hypothetical protein
MSTKMTEKVAFVVFRLTAPERAWCRGDREVMYNGILVRLGKVRLG